MPANTPSRRKPKVPELLDDQKRERAARGKIRRQYGEEVVEVLDTLHSEVEIEDVEYLRSIL